MRSGRVICSASLVTGLNIADEVVFLEGVLLRVVERDAADQDDHRRVRHVRGRHAGQQIGRAGAAGDQAHARQVGHARESPSAMNAAACSWRTLMYSIARSS